MNTYIIEGTTHKLNKQFLNGSYILLFKKI